MPPRGRRPTVKSTASSASEPTPRPFRNRAKPRDGCRRALPLAKGPVAAFPGSNRRAPVLAALSASPARTLARSFSHSIRKSRRKRNKAQGENFWRSITTTPQKGELHDEHALDDQSATPQPRARNAGAGHFRGSGDSRNRRSAANIDPFAGDPERLAEACSEAGRNDPKRHSNRTVGHCDHCRAALVRSASNKGQCEAQYASRQEIPSLHIGCGDCPRRVFIASQPREQVAASCRRTRSASVEQRRALPHSQVGGPTPPAPATCRTRTGRHGPPRTESPPGASPEPFGRFPFRLAAAAESVADQSSFPPMPPTGGWQAGGPTLLRKMIRCRRCRLAIRRGEICRPTRQSCKAPGRPRISHGPGKRSGEYPAGPQSERCEPTRRGSVPRHDHSAAVATNVEPTTNQSPPSSDRRSAIDNAFIRAYTLDTAVDSEPAQSGFDKRSTFTSADGDVLRAKGAPERTQLPGRKASSSIRRRLPKDLRGARSVRHAPPQLHRRPASGPGIMRLLIAEP